MKYENINAVVGSAGAGAYVAAITMKDQIIGWLGLIGAAMTIWAVVDTLLKNKSEKKANKMQIEESREVIKSEKLQQELAMKQMELADKQLKRLDDEEI